MILRCLLSASKSRRGNCICRHAQEIYLPPKRQLCLQARTGNLFAAYAAPTHCAGEVADGRGGGGRRRPLGFGLSGFQCPPDLEEGAGGGGGPAVEAVRPAEDAERRRRAGGPDLRGAVRAAGAKRGRRDGG